MNARLPGNMGCRRFHGKIFLSTAPDHRACRSRATSPTQPRAVPATGNQPRVVVTGGHSRATPRSATVRIPVMLHRATGCKVRTENPRRETHSGLRRAACALCACGACHGRHPHADPRRSVRGANHPIGRTYPRQQLAAPATTQSHRAGDATLRRSGVLQGAGKLSARRSRATARMRPHRADHPARHDRWGALHRSSRRRTRLR